MNKRTGREIRRPALGRRLAGGTLVWVLATSLAAAAPGVQHLAIDQKLDAATLQRYHHTDQGTRLVPAAWLAAVDQADGSGKFMAAAHLQQMGFITQPVVVNALNPYGWPIGFTVSNPARSGGVAIAGLSCAACHTGQLAYKGQLIRIEGGQSLVNLTPFFNGLSKAFVAMAKDPARRDRFFTEAVAAGYPADRMAADFQAAAKSFGALTESGLGTAVGGVLSGPGRQDAVQGIANKLLGDNLLVPGNRQGRDAPISIPYLWDIGRLSWVQTNGFMSGAQSTSRNIGEVLGVFGSMQMLAPDGRLNPEPLRWQTSVQLDGLLWMEQTLGGLRAPTWPAQVLGAINADQAAVGKTLFSRHCVACHGIKELPSGTWDVSVVPLRHIGTDPAMVMNYAARSYDASKLGLGKQTAVPQALDAVTKAVREQLYAEHNTPAAERERDALLPSPCGYKARPLIGVWATPPFLHNGSVRTLFDLLSERRPARFTVGSLEFDPVNVGYTEGPGADPFVLDTRLPGNRNTGHWWTDDRRRPGRIGPKLSDAEKYALIEFLKSATYDNYPSEKRAQPAALPCQGQPRWALKQ